MCRVCCIRNATDLKNECNSSWHLQEQMPRGRVSASRSRNMSAIRSRDTKPEMVVRRFLHGRGLRFRLHADRLPGKPDLVFKKYNCVVFVHGCFWHHHGCANSVWPKTRREFWRAKIMGNVRRDRRTSKQLAQLGWRVFEVWECEAPEARTLGRLHRRIIAFRPYS